MSSVNGNAHTKGLLRYRRSRWRSAAIPGAIITPAPERFAAMDRELLRERLMEGGHLWEGTAGAPSNVESEIDDVPVTDHVGLPFEPEEALGARGGQTPGAHEVGV
jgi:hypothetical protein